MYFRTDLNSIFRSDDERMSAIIIRMIKGKNNSADSFRSIKANAINTVPATIQRIPLCRILPTVSVITPVKANDAVVIV